MNTEWDEGIISFSPDGSTMYLTRAIRTPDRNTGVDIYTSRRSDAQWSAPVKLEITNDTLSSYGHPAVSPSGEYLYFTSDMPGHGGKDIRRIKLNERAGSLENLVDAINTPGDEVFPYMLTDSIMYFSSDGHPGLGGLDIFRATLTPSGGWLVENMGSPINSEGDDFGITFANPSKESGYFSSNRGDGRGYDHLYSFELPDLKIQISGWVLDRDEEPVPNAVIRIVGNDGSNRESRSPQRRIVLLPAAARSALCDARRRKRLSQRQTGIHIRYCRRRRRIRHRLHTGLDLKTKHRGKYLLRF